QSFVIRPVHRACFTTQRTERTTDKARDGVAPAWFSVFSAFSVVKSPLPGTKASRATAAVIVILSLLAAFPASAQVTDQAAPTDSVVAAPADSLLAADTIPTDSVAPMPPLEAAADSVLRALQ